MIRRRIAPILIVAILALAVGCQAAPKATTASQTATIQRGNLTATLSAAGVVAAESQAAKAPGRSR
jgi:uncharacterized membrane protein YjfL (UPF0719 family)